MNILFLCTGNSCRSQMAEAWAKKYWQNSSYQFYSAGIEAHGLNPHAVEVMQELGVDMSGHQSNTINEFSDMVFDVVITVCSNADETCPVLELGTRKIHVGFDDPPKLALKARNTKEALDCYRQVRDQIREFIESLDTVLQTDKPHSYSLR